MRPDWTICNDPDCEVCVVRHEHDRVDNVVTASQDRDER